MSPDSLRYVSAPDKHRVSYCSSSSVVFRCLGKQFGVAHRRKIWKRCRCLVWQQDGCECRNVANKKKTRFVDCWESRHFSLLVKYRSEYMKGVCGLCRCKMHRYTWTPGPLGPQNGFPSSPTSARGLVIDSMGLVIDTSARYGHQALSLTPGLWIPGPGTGFSYWHQGYWHQCRTPGLVIDTWMLVIHKLVHWLVHIIFFRCWCAF